MTELAFCASHLSLVCPEEPVTGEDLKEFVASVESLSEDVRNGTFDPDVKAVLLTVLEALRHAASMYRIRGAAAFHDALVTALGELALRPEVMAKTEGTPAMSKLTMLLQHAGRIAQRARPVLEFAKLALDVRALLTGGAPPPA